MLYIQAEQVEQQLLEILLQHDVNQEDAKLIAHTMCQISLDGVYSHGINRFPRLIRNIREGIVVPNVRAERVSGLGGYEIWDGNLGIGVINATICTQRVAQLAREHGIGCVALRHTNHWMRAGTYGLMLANEGMLGLLWTNTVQNMIAWGAVEPVLGNNPIVFAVPHRGGPVVADLSTSQFSYGKMEVARLKGELMPCDAGLDRDGNLTRDPNKVLETRCVLPAGLWKGSAQSLLLDLIAACASFGNTSASLSRLPGDEHSLSQIFIAINPAALGDPEQIESLVDDTLHQLLSARSAPGKTIRYPGQAMQSIRKENLEKGIPVDEAVWKQVLELRKP